MFCVCENILLSDISSKLTSDSLKEFLREEFGPDAEFVQYKILTGASKGESYLSTVYRIEVEGKSSRDEKKLVLHLIVKCLPASAARRKTFRSLEFFRNEVAFYNKVVPAFIEFQNKQKPKHPFVEFPRCYFALADGENDIVVMEDVSYKNYKTTNRQDGLNYEQCEILMNVLGRFHALSIAMKEKEPGAFKEAVSSLFETYYKPETKAWYINQLQLFTDIAIDAVTKELLEKVYEEKLRRFADNSCFDRMCEYVKPKEPYAVISHGDAWAPNFLVRRSAENENGKVEGICMIDYQLARYSSPVLDISFFLYSCASENVLFNQFDDILKAYYKSLIDFVTDLGLPAEILFPFKEFQKEILSYFAFGLGMSLESVPLSILDADQTPDVESMSGEEEIPLTEIWALKPIESKEGRMRLALNVKHAVDNKFIL
ncbi:hypothetical protein R5R35_013696 [Gryllus longicercus]|uniref:CHK kinase-like domain-containing protein n=1 Tax=Gryllus longicercus TaxID=2509291 RepID=A0AAN9WA08_9ORTH